LTKKRASGCAKHNPSVQRKQLLVICSGHVCQYQFFCFLLFILTVSHIFVADDTSLSIDDTSIDHSKLEYGNDIVEVYLSTEPQGLCDA